MLTRLQEMVVPWDPAPLTARREAALRALIWPAISLTITLVLLVVIAAWNSASTGGAALPFLVVFFSISVLTGAGILAYGILRAVRAHQELSEVGQGTALQLDHRGISTSQGHADWDQVQAIVTRPGGLLHGPLLVVEHELGRDEYPVEGLGVLPAGLESSVRIFSRGRHGVDLSAIED